MNEINHPNAKNPDWEVPVNLPHANPQDYSKAIDSANGSAASNNDSAARNVEKPNHQKK